MPPQRRNRWLLWAGVVLGFFTYALFTLTVPLYALTLGAPPQVIGGLVGLGFLVQVLIAVPVGSLIDRRGGRVAITFGPLIIGLACAVPALIPGLPAVAAAEILMGTGQILFLLASQSETASSGTRVRRAAGFGALTAAIAAGQTVGPLVGGLIINNFGAQSALASGAIVAGLASLAMYAWHGAGSTIGKAARGPGQQGAGRMKASSAVFYAIAVSVSVVFGRVVYTTFLPVYLKGHGFRATSIGEITALLGLVTFSVRPVLASIARMLGGMVRTMIVCTAAAGVGITLVALPPGWTVVLTMTVLLGFGAGLGQPLSMAMVVDAVTENQRGLVLGTRLVANRVTQVVGPFALGFVAGALGLRAVFILSGASILGLAPFLAFFSSTVAERIAAAQRPRA